MVEPDFAAAVTRRGWLKAAAAGVAGALLNGCATGFGPREYRRPYSALPFSRPLVSEERVLRTRVGLRPFRAGGFVVRGERLAEPVVSAKGRLSWAMNGWKHLPVSVTRVMGPIIRRHISL